MSIRSIALVATMVVASLPGAAVALAQDAPTRRPDVIYVPTPEAVVEAMLQVANVGKNDIVYDLGCGDGRIPVTAAKKYGARGVGIDIDPQRIKEANENVAKNNVGDRVRIVQGDLFEQDLSQATVVTLYLLPSLNVKLMPKLMKELKPGTRIVSHAFDMGDWKPEKELDVEGRKVYYWTIPKR
ncbi:MAG: 50S ribosomal protein L11 methyltransferase [Acidobacteria bacterium]|nr:50S ribosomal protein L11 methyltransferase [Acidobacteriota bacterium]